jgi:glycosyltransferase involved in cell wall biosynthesis
MANIKFSIITTVKNGASTIGRLINSLNKQTYNNFEWTVWDCNSSDGTNQIIKNNYKRKLILKSGNDKNMYDGWNKILKYSSGDWILFLGADDILYGQDVLMKVANKLSKLSKIDDIGLVYGNVSFMDENFSLLRTINLNKQISSNRFSFGRPFHPVHTETFHNAKLFFENCYPINLNYHICGDSWIMLTLIKKYKIRYIDLDITKMSLTGISFNWRNSIAIHNQCRKICKELNIYVPFINICDSYIRGHIKLLLSFVISLKMQIKINQILN